MRLRFIWPGKTKDEHLRALAEEYLKRLSRFVRCELIETREGTEADPASLKKESQRRSSSGDRWTQWSQRGSCRSGSEALAPDASNADS